MKPGVATRLHAAQLLSRISDEGAHSNVVLAGELGERRAFVERLVMDALRYMPRTDAVVGQLSNRPLDDLDPLVRSSLRVGVTELLLGGDAHGVVDSTVEAVRRAGVPRATGFVNAVLRRVAQGAFREPPELRSGTPPWIRRRLESAWGSEATDSFLAACLEPPHIGIRLRPGADPVGTPVARIPGAAYVATPSDIAGRDDLLVMDPSSTAVANAVGAAPGQRVLDVAAAPGNKTAALWDAMAGDGLLVATDRHRRRTASAARRLRRLGVGALWVISDGAAPFVDGGFDRILLDAPCTGLGTIRRRPEIKSRLDQEAPRRMARLQRRLVEGVRRLLRPDGRLVYSVCTVFPEETVEIADFAGGRPPDDVPGRRWGGGVLLAPDVTGTDGMFITVIDG